MDINYYCQECDYRLRHKRAIREWLREVALCEGDLQIGEINYIFCPSNVHRQMNIDFVGHDYFTDIITFEYCEGDRLSGDLFISVDSVRENAVEYGTDFKDELNRVIVHGILHLIGYDDHCDEDIAEMRSKENYYLSLRELL